MLSSRACAMPNVVLLNDQVGVTAAKSGYWRLAINDFAMWGVQYALNNGAETSCM